MYGEREPNNFGMDPSESSRRIRKEVLGLVKSDESVLASTAESDPRTIKWHDALLGRICSGKAFVTGVDFGGYNTQTEDGLWFEWISDKDNKDIELRWNGAPFLQLDDELKVLLLSTAGVGGGSGRK
jgi:hypothetical protein